MLLLNRNKSLMIFEKVHLPSAIIIILDVNGLGTTILSFIAILYWTIYCPANSKRPHWVPLMSFLQQTGKRGYNLQVLTKIGQLKTGKMLPGLTSLNFC